MKNKPPLSSHSSHSDPLEENDPLWDLLEKASTQEPSAFFARNVVRSVRQLDAKPSAVSALSSRIFSLFTSRKLALTAVACTCALVTFQLWPKNTPEIPKIQQAQSEQPTQTPAPQVATVITTNTITDVDTATSFSELIIEESLLAAADDPSMFTRNELVAMIGL